MILKSYRITHYRNIEDSGVIPVDPKVTCLVGKNESGKTNLLQSLRRLNPIDGVEFNVTNDYPRRHMNAYERKIEKGGSQDKVVVGVFELDNADVRAVTAKFGACVEAGQTLTYTVDHANKKFVDMKANETAFLKFAVSTSNLPDAIKSPAQAAPTLTKLIEVLNQVGTDANVAALLAKLTPMQTRTLSLTIWDQVLRSRCPKIMYFDDYRLMAGTANLADLTSEDKIDENEHLETLMELLKLAGVTPESLMEDENYEHHKAKIESIANEITDDVFQYWKQNTELEVEFDVHRKSGQNNSPDFYVRIKNTRHKATVPFDERSKGFVWFFSFMTAFRCLAEESDRMIILLDEPGLSLHASAQADLLAFIEERLAPDHQVIYTTHSPFMLDSTKLLRVRTVEDTPDKGAIVRADCFGADAVTVFPLQAALSYSLAQTLFLGPDCLLVEGPSDLLYLQTISELLSQQKRTVLDPRWVITPVGGSGKLSTFASLIGANQLNVSVLMDFSKKDQQLLDNLQQEGFLDRKNVVLYKTFTGGTESDVEDMFSEATYFQLVKLAYPGHAKKLKPSKENRHPRIVERVKAVLTELGEANFNHFKVAKASVPVLGTTVPVDDDTLERFETLFKHLNGLLAP
jgi:predicted ATPase